MRKSLGLFLVAALLVIGGCKKDKKPDETQPTTPKTADTPAPTTPAPTTPPPTTPPPAMDPSAMKPSALQAAFKADKTKVLGTKVKVQGYYINSNEVTMGDKVSWNFIVADDKGKTDSEMTVSCHLDKSPDDLKRDDLVTIEGKVDDTMGAVLRECTYTK